MGLGDVHLMAAAGAAIGWAGITLAFFVAPFMGLLIGLILLIRKGKRELPYGPYLSIAIVIVILLEDRLVAWFAPGLGAMLRGS
jgi:leader peptidase (prepilin peptidase)/N-methyltransferase